MFKLAKYLKPYRKQTIIGPIFKLIEAIFELLVPVIMAKIIDYGINGDRGKEYIWKMGILLLVLAIVGYASSLVCQTIASITSQGYGTILRDALYQHINTLSFTDIDRLGQSTLITRLTSDINQMQIAVAMLIRLVIRAPFLVIGATIMAALINLKIALIFLIVAIGIAFVLYFVMSRSVHHYKNVQGNLDNLTVITRENIEGTRVVRAFARQEYEKKRFEEGNNQYSQTVINVSKISSLLNPLTYLLVNAGIIAILYFGGNLITLNQMSQGDLTALINYMFQIMLALIVVANLFVIFTKASASAQRINEVLNTVPEVINGTRDNLQKQENIIEFKNVFFAYDGTNTILENISFKIKAQQNFGIIGVTGSGKSTIANLLCNFYNVSSGNILINNVDIKEISNQYLRQNISYVMQKNVLFIGTIRENMNWRNLNISDEEIWKALKIAQAFDFVNDLPNKLDYQITQGGKNLSGGQRQRLCIAKALINTPEILILDDCASALDYATDAALRKALKTISGMTTIIISQRIMTIKNCQTILCLDEGKIIGLGTHQYLMENCEKYQEIYYSQFEGESNE